MALEEVNVVTVVVNWGGGVVGWLRPVLGFSFSQAEQNLRPNYYFGPRIIFGLKFSSSKNFFGAKTFWTEIFLKQNFVLTKYLTHSLA